MSGLEHSVFLERERILNIIMERPEICVDPNNAYGYCKLYDCKTCWESLLGFKEVEGG